MSALSRRRLALLALAQLLACTAAIPPCDAASCADGCCSAAGVCVAGRTVFECGLGGVACARCEDTQVCRAGQCAAPLVDGGALDAGADDGGATDGGGPGDAGSVSTRTVTVRRTQEVVDVDGGVRAVPTALTGLGLALVREQDDGGFATTPSSGGFTEAAFPDVPVGPFFVRFGAGAPLFVDTDADTVELGARFVGRRSALFAAGTSLRLDAGLPFPAIPSDVLTLTSLVSGYAKDVASVSRGPGGLNVVHVGDLSTGVQPFGWDEGDPLVVTLNRSTSDGGTFQAAVASGVLSAPAATLALPGTAALALAPVPPASAAVSAALSELTQFVGDVSPDALAQAARVTAFYVPRPDVDAGGVEGRTAFVWAASVAAGADLDGVYGWGNPFAGAPVHPQLRAALSVSVPLTYQGRTLTRTLDALTTARFVVDGGVVLRPALSPVRSLRLNGETAFVARNGVSTTPTVSWLPPAQGTPTVYRLFVWRVAAQGSTLTVTQAALLVTTRTALRLPPDVLRVGEAYSLWVVAQRVPGVDARQRPFLSAAEPDEASAVTAVFTP